MGLERALLLAAMLQDKPPPVEAGWGSGLLHTVLVSLLFVGIGVLVFLIAFLLMTKISPFSVRKEIEEDQNTALAIVMGSVIIGLAIIIAAAIH